MSRSSSLAVSVPIIQQEASRQSTIARQQQQKEVQPQPPQGQLTSSSLPPEDNAQLKTISAGVDTQRKFETESERSATKKKKKILPHTYVHFIAGAAGGAVGSFLTMPFEVVRTRLQARYNKQQITGQEGLLRGTFSAMRRIYDLEGLRGLWRGLGPALTGVIPSRAVQFSTYSMMKQQLEPKLGDGTALHLIAGSVAGCISAIAMSPVWLVKTRLQLQTKEMAQQGLAYKNSWDCVRRVYKEEGILAFYKGLAPSLIGMIGLSIQFTLYEKGKAIILARKGNNAELDSVEYLAVASAAKGIASVITYPHEVLRTRFREQRAVKNPKYTGIVQALKLIAKEEGLAAWYGGMGPHLLKVVPNSAFMFLTYEVVVRLLTPRDDEGV